MHTGRKKVQLVRLVVRRACGPLRGFEARCKGGREAGRRTGVGEVQGAEQGSGEEQKIHDECSGFSPGCQDLRNVCPQGATRGWRRNAVWKISPAPCEFLFWGCCVLAHKVHSRGRACGGGGLRSFVESRETQHSLTRSTTSELSSGEYEHNRICPDLLRAEAPYTRTSGSLGPGG